MSRSSRPTAAEVVDDFTDAADDEQCEDELHWREQLEPEVPEDLEDLPEKVTELLHQCGHFTATMPTNCALNATPRKTATGVKLVRSPCSHASTQPMATA